MREDVIELTGEPLVGRSEIRVDELKVREAQGRLSNVRKFDLARCAVNADKGGLSPIVCKP
jgi:hypothetical protein